VVSEAVATSTSAAPGGASTVVQWGALLLEFWAGRLVAKHSRSKQKRIQAAFLINSRHGKLSHPNVRSPKKGKNKNFTNQTNNKYKEKNINILKTNNKIYISFDKQTAIYI